MARIVILDSSNTDAGIAYLSEGRGAPAVVLIVSWSTPTEAARATRQIEQCGAWGIATEEGILSIVGQGSMISVQGEEAHTIFSSTWTMEDPYAVSLFHQIARTHGYFLLLPAVNKMPWIRPPLVCYLA